MEIIPKLDIVFIQLLGFVLVLVVLKMFLFKPLLAMLDARRSEIDGDYARAAEDRKAAEAEKTDYDQRLASVEEDIRKMKAEEVKEAQRLRDEIVTDARTNAERILQKAQQEIDREREKAFVELKTVVASLAVEAAGKLLEADLDAQKHAGLIDKFIDSIHEAPR